MVMPPRPSSTDHELHHRQPIVGAHAADHQSYRSFRRRSPTVPAPPSRGRPTPAGATTPRLKPGTTVLVRRRSEKTMAGKAVVLWLLAIGHVSATDDDGGYDVVNEGKLP